MKKFLAEYGGAILGGLAITAPIMIYMIWG